MTDREKVKAGLSQCLIPETWPEHEEQCVDCPYRDEEKCQEHLRQNALEMFEAVKPIKTPEIIRSEYNCGNCQGRVGIRFFDGEWFFRANYCPKCGRKVKWDETT